MPSLVQQVQYCGHGLVLQQLLLVQLQAPGGADARSRIDSPGVSLQSPVRINYRGAC